MRRNEDNHADHTRPPNRLRDWLLVAFSALFITLAALAMLAGLQSCSPHGP